MFDTSNIVLVECVPRLLSLTSTACVADWRRAQIIRPEPWENRWHCRGCAIGCHRAGEGPAIAEQTNQIDGVRKICIRCHRQSERLLINGLYDPSCYNRILELQKGKNGRGVFPSIIAKRYPLHAINLHYKSLIGDSKWTWTKPINKVSNTLEAMLSLLKLESHSLCFSRPTMCTVSSQLSFWDGI